MTISDDSEDDKDYAPTKKEEKEAADDSSRLKRQKFFTEAAQQPQKLQAKNSSSKVEDIWHQLQATRGGAKSRAFSKLNTTTPIFSADREWMRQLDVPSRQAHSSPQEKDSATVYSTAKKRPQLEIQAKSKQNDATKSLDLQSAARAIAAAKLSSLVSGHSPGKVAVTEQRQFAGKQFQVSTLTSPEEALKLASAKKAGLDTIIASLQGAKKVNVLDKSRHDWGAFKKEDAKVEEELEAYKKSDKKYLDKVDFLKRAELREFEAEREQRLATQNRTN